MSERENGEGQIRDAAMVAGLNPKAKDYDAERTAILATLIKARKVLGLLGTDGTDLLDIPDGYDLFHEIGKYLARCPK